MSKFLIKPLCIASVAWSKEINCLAYPSNHVFFILTEPHCRQSCLFLFLYFNLWATILTNICCHIFLWGIWHYIITSIICGNMCASVKPYTQLSISMAFRKLDLGWSTICIVDVHYQLLTIFLLLEFRN